MKPYDEMYVTLFHAVSDALKLLKDGHIHDGIQELIAGQLAAEEIYIETEEASEGND